MAEFRILSIDGGGIRGAYPAHILKRTCDGLGVPIRERIDMVAGTSTGAIIAAAVACDIEPARICDLYRNHAAEIFKRRGRLVPKQVFATIASLYKTSPLACLLRDEFGEKRTLGDITIPLILPATNISGGQVHPMKSRYDPAFHRDPRTPVWQVVLASCAAPTYFDPVQVDEYLLADGGLWANNPALVAAVDAKKRLGADWNSMRVLSLGTGECPPTYRIRPKWKVRTWGFAAGWGGGRFVDLLLSLQSQSAHNYLKLILGEDRVLRINFQIPDRMDLDDISRVDDLRAQADRDFTHSADKILQLLAPRGN